MRCSKCGAENPEGKQFCGHCGAVLGNRCPQCGADNAVGKRFAVIAAPHSLAALHS
jgi:ribosomal protein L40E